MNKKVLFGAVTILGATLLGTVGSYSAEGNGAPATRLINEAQYVNTLRMIFGQDLRITPKFAPVPRVQGLIAIGSSVANMTSGALDQFDAVARIAAEQVTSSQKRDFSIPCHPKSDTAADDKCAGEFLPRVGSLLFRRPLTSAEAKVLVTFAHEDAEQLHDFYRGVAVVLSSLLVSPEFLYITQPTETVRGQLRLTSLGKATRLSLLLWNSYPDEELLKAAQAGALDTQKGLETQVTRMVASPRLGSGVRGFFDDMLVFENFDTLVKDTTTYPSFTHKVGEDAREQTLRTLVAHVVRDDADYRDIFTTRKTFLTNDLGSIYGIKIDKPEEWIPYEFPAGDPRAGVLTQVSFTALYAQPGRTSSTRRGKAIREVFLCQKVPDPPPNVDFSKLQNPDPALHTARDRLEAHRQNPVCAGCHRITDPIGLALENFDGAGFYRSNEADAPIDASGFMDGASFTGAEGLSRALHDNPKVTSCLTHRMLGYALGRPLDANDDTMAENLTTDFAQHGYRVKHLLQNIATSEAFYSVGDRAVKNDTPKAKRRRTLF